MWKDFAGVNEGSDSPRVVLLLMDAVFGEHCDVNSRFLNLGGDLHGHDQFVYMVNRVR
jgi:hypothetical protein